MAHSDRNLSECLVTSSEPSHRRRVSLSSCAPFVDASAKGLVCQDCRLNILLRQICRGTRREGTHQRPLLPQTPFREAILSSSFHRRPLCRHSQRSIPAASRNGKVSAVASRPSRQFSAATAYVATLCHQVLLRFRRLHCPTDMTRNRVQILIDTQSMLGHYSQIFAKLGNRGCLDVNLAYMKSPRLLR